MQITTRADALVLGLKEFYDGSSCVRGHTTARNTKYGYCVCCRREDVKKHQEVKRPIRELLAASNAEARKYNPWRKPRLTPEQKEAGKLRRREKQREHNRKWASQNRDYRRAQTKIRKANKKSNVPRWLTLADKKEMAAVYRLARDRTEISGVPYEVDHIIPLRGRTVCGLHVPWNLQVLTREDNLRKGNTLN